MTMDMRPDDVKVKVVYDGPLPPSITLAIPNDNMELMLKDLLEEKPEFARDIVLLNAASMTIADAELIVERLTVAIKMARALDKGQQINVSMEVAER